MLSNYLLYIIFISTTIAYVVFAFRLAYAPNSCYANTLSTVPVPASSGRDVKDNFQFIFVVGSICGVLEIARNSINLWAKCFNYQNLAIAFQILGFITAFLFLFNFIMMQLYRFTHNGRVCSGDYKGDDRDFTNREYLVEYGFFIYVLIWCYYSMIALLTISVSCFALTLKYHRNN